MSTGRTSPAPPTWGNGTSVVKMARVETVEVGGVACGRAAVSARTTMRKVRIFLCITRPPSGAMLLLVLGQREDVLLAREVAVLDELGLREVARLAELERHRDVGV